MYPKAFGEAIRQRFPEFKSRGEGKPQLAESSEELSGPEAFEQAPWSTWEDAGLTSVMRYLRGNKNLCAPERWRNVFPKELEVIHRLETCKRSSEHLD